MSNEALTLQLLAWVAEKPRSYGSTMEAWRTTCPRLTIWEDAVTAGWIGIGKGASMTERPVALTAQGRALLENADPRVAALSGTSSLPT